MVLYNKNFSMLNKFFRSVLSLLAALPPCNVLVCAV